MRPKKLAILGASYLQLPLVLKAKEMGLEVYCFSWEEGAVCKEFADRFFPISAIDTDAILPICQELEIDGITSIASDAVVPTLNHIASVMGLIGNSPKRSSVLTNKYEMRKALSSSLSNVPLFKNIHSTRQLNECSDMLTGSFPVIVKPVDRSGSRGVTKVFKVEELSVAVERGIEESFSNEVVIESFIEGVEYSVETISWKGRHHLLAITEKETTSAPYFVELAHHQPANLRVDLIEKVQETVFSSLSTLGVDYGAGHSEIKITADEDIFVIEIAARMGGDFIGSNLVQLSTGYDFLKGVIEVALGNFTDPVFGQKQNAGVYFLSKETEYLLEVLDHLQKYPEVISSEIFSRSLSPVKSSSDRSGYFIYCGLEKMTYNHLKA